MNTQRKVKTMLNTTNGTGTIKARVAAFLLAHPKATNKEVAEALGANPKTTFNYIKGYGDKDRLVTKPVHAAPSEMPIAQATPLEVLKSRKAHLETEIKSVTDMKKELLRVNAAIKALEG